MPESMLPAKIFNEKCFECRARDFLKIAFKEIDVNQNGEDTLLFQMSYIKNKGKAWDHRTAIAKMKFL